MSKSLIPRGSGLPRVDIYRDQETPIPENEYKVFSESIGQIKNAELLRSQLIGLQQLRADNAIGLSELEGKYLELDVTNQKNQTLKARYAQELQRTNLELLKVDGLTLQGAIEGTKNQGLNLDLSFEKANLQLTRTRLQLQLQSGQLANSETEQKLKDATSLLRQRFTGTTIEIPSVSVA